MRKLRPGPHSWQVARLEFKPKQSGSRKSPHYYEAKQIIALVFCLFGFLFFEGKHKIVMMIT